MAGPIQEVHARESHFHDAWAQSTKVESALVRECFEAPTAPENQFILRHMGPLAGRRVLDLGAGLGESSVYFALRGARVTAADISPQMVVFAVELGKRYGVQLEGLECAGESLNAPENHYDFVYLGNVLHHATDKERLFRQVHRVLKPGGRFYAIDPLAYNPLINVYRRMATAVRTEDERPLTFGDVKLARRFFARVGHREFWIFTLSLFLKYYLIDRLDPNTARYWKLIQNENNLRLWWWQPLRVVDMVLTKLPLVRRLAWNMVLHGVKA